MDFRQLRNFIQVVELSSITAAAERLNIAQPALSRQVKALEEELSVSLLRRHGRGVMPTEEGIRLARRAKAILEEMEDLAGLVRATIMPLRPAGRPCFPLQSRHWPEGEVGLG